MKRNGSVVMGIAVIGLGLVFGGLTIFDGQISEAETPVGPNETVVTPSDIPLEDQAPLEMPAESALTVDMKFGSEIVDREPQGEQNAFSVNKGDLLKFYCWNRVKGAKEETTVTHVWYLNDKKIAEVPLAVKSGNFRTWSSKRFTDTMTGEGRVDVLDDKGITIGTLAYTVIPGEEAPKEDTIPEGLSLEKAAR